jgi:hypothetical protein
MARKPKPRDDAGEELELEQDVKFQRAEWRVQRVAWGVMVLVIVAALAGLAGPGPLSATHREAGGVAVRYDRFLRYGVDTELEIAVRGARPDSLVVRVARDFLARFEIVQTHPEPVAQWAGADALVHVFALADARPTRVLYRLEPKSSGRARGTLSVDGAGAVDVDAFVYP